MNSICLEEGTQLFLDLFILFNLSNMVSCAWPDYRSSGGYSRFSKSFDSVRKYSIMTAA